MGKRLKQYLTAFLLAALMIGWCDRASAANTKFTNVEVTGSFTVDGASTHTGAVTNSGTQSNTGSVTNSNTTTLSTTTFTGGFAPMSRTVSQINSLLSTTTGQVVFCSDCTRSALCVSTGTVTAGSWSVASSTAASPSYTTIHCQ